MPLPFTSIDVDGEGMEAHDPVMFTHVVPLNDLKEHALSCDCWCQPFFDRDHNIFVHHSFDGRECVKH